jgi:uncharacterized damage-inducible protein DinB
MNFQQGEKSRLLSQFDLFNNSIENTPGDKRNWKPDDNLMSPQELMEHVTGANYYFAAMLKGEEPPSPPEGAPPQLSFEEAQSAFNESCNMMAETIASIGDSDLTKEIPMPNGGTTSMQFMMTVPTSHISYHWGQLASLQKMYGDDKDHFFEDPNFKFGSRF